MGGIGNAGEPGFYCGSNCRYYGTPEFGYMVLFKSFIELSFNILKLLYINQKIYRFFCFFLYVCRYIKYVSFYKFGDTK